MDAATRQRVSEMLENARRSDPSRWQIIDGRSDAYYYFGETLPYDAGKTEAHIYFATAGFSAFHRYGIPIVGHSL